MDRWRLHTDVLKHKGLTACPNHCIIALYSGFSIGEIEMKFDISDEALNDIVKDQVERIKGFWGVSDATGKIEETMCIKKQLRK